MASKPTYEELELKIEDLQQTLLKNEERTALAHQAGHLGTWEWDIHSGGIFWSEQIYPIFGLTPENSEMTFDVFLACIPSEDRSHVEASVNAAVYEGKTYDIEHAVRHPDGSLRWVSERGRVFRDEAGNPIRMLGVVQDLTERKQGYEKTKTLSGIMPICSNCKQIRDAQGSWHQIETYIRDHSTAKFSHSICPECAKSFYPDYDLDL
ncbi:MAG: PAS domain-containing protein [Nitrospirota bacterium]|nr:PAS domain-containing protein [Nitrospirota bacterium]